MAVRVPRRALFVVGAAAAAVSWTEVIWPRIAGLLGPDLTFEPIAGLPGYKRVVVTGDVSGPGIDPFVGLAVPGQSEDSQVPRPRMPNDPCRALYETTGSQQVPLAVFTDFNCPYCRILDRRLLDLAETRSDLVSLRIHQLPLLGESSLWGARGALAAGQQDAYIAFHKSLMGAAFAIDPDYLVLVAEKLGLDKDKMMRDAMGPIVASQIAGSRAFAERLGIIGTPGLLVGRSLILGNVSDAILEQLIALESSEASPPNCAVFA